jgi:hypothetical protein
MAAKIDLIQLSSSPEENMKTGGWTTDDTKKKTCIAIRQTAKKN